MAKLTSYIGARFVYKQQKVLLVMLRSSNTSCACGYGISAIWPRKLGTCSVMISIKCFEKAKVYLNILCEQRRVTSSFTLALFTNNSESATWRTEVISKHVTSFQATHDSIRHVSNKYSALKGSNMWVNWGRFTLVFALASSAINESSTCLQTDFLWAIH